MKNQRSVCLAREAGYIEYEGLPGSIKTGCMRTPELKSRYCSLHSSRICTVPPDKSKGEDGFTGIVITVLQKKETRNGRYFNVSFNKNNSYYLHNACLINLLIFC